MSRASITRRWLINSLGVITAVLAAAVILLSVVIKTYYYDSVKQMLIGRMNMITAAVNNIQQNSNASFNNNLKNMVESYSEKDRAELMVLNGEGRILITSSGFIPEYDMPDSDFIEAMETGNIAQYQGRMESGEKIMSIAVATPNYSGEYSTLRLVTSLTEVDRTVNGYIITLWIVTLAILILMMASGLYFVKSIVIPVRQIGHTARRFAKGDFSVRIAKKNDDEIGELCDIINHMAEEISAAEAMKNEFISSVSHELRTPLTAIKGWAETLNVMTDDPEAVAKGMRVIIRETERLSGMVEELLDFSRMQNGRFTLQMAKMDILAELGDAVLIYTEKARQDEIEVVYDEPEMLPFICGDKNRIRQVFINVIDNAIKYSDKGGLVSIQSGDTGDGFIEIDVSDTGCGIRPQDLPKIKTKFYKANHTRRGSGIGLAVADEIVTMHGGTLDVLSEQGVGTTVVVRLPISED